MASCRPKHAFPLLALCLMLLAGIVAQAQERASDGERALLLPTETPAGATDFSRGTVTFIGSATVLLEFAGFTVLTDPDFLRKGEQASLGAGLSAERLTDPAIEFEQLPAIDLVLLSHMHGDHLDPLLQQQLARDMPIVTTPEAARVLGESGFRRRFGLATWDRMTIRKGDAMLRITSMPARRGPLLLAWALPEAMGSMLDFITAEGNIAYRIYITGDTLLHDAIKDIPRRYPDIDLALLHLGGMKATGMGRVTMDAEQGVRMMQIVAPRHAVPIHFDDYDVFRSPIGDFERQAQAAGLRARLSFLRQGERYEFAGR
ncbi:MBL fold metallo-hydrolase [Lacisediminimonas profundi]|uniref:MBL fold metallo-hydrolase n=1 Tax=Lacisediminimonas profundi TaxID=2603856 RepID=UPI0019D4FDF4|nr:MBL fold metallo-hydrolase [Lacisediminimonas profundi]